MNLFFFLCLRNLLVRFHIVFKLGSFWNFGFFFFCFLLIQIISDLFLLFFYIDISSIILIEFIFVLVDHDWSIYNVFFFFVLFVLFILLFCFFLLLMYLFIIFFLMVNIFVIFIIFNFCCFCYFICFYFLRFYFYLILMVRFYFGYYYYYYCFFSIIYNLVPILNLGSLVVFNINSRSLVPVSSSYGFLVSVKVDDSIVFLKYDNFVGVNVRPDGVYINDFKVGNSVDFFSSALLQRAIFYEVFDNMSVSEDESFVSCVCYLGEMCHYVRNRFPTDDLILGYINSGVMDLSNFPIVVYYDFYMVIFYCSKGFRPLRVLDFRDRLYGVGFSNLLGIHDVPSWDSYYDGDYDNLNLYSFVVFVSKGFRDQFWSVSNRGAKAVKPTITISYLLDNCVFNGSKNMFSLDSSKIKLDVLSNSYSDRKRTFIFSNFFYSNVVKGFKNLYKFDFGNIYFYRIFLSLFQVLKSKGFFSLFGFFFYFISFIIVFPFFIIGIFLFFLFLIIVFFKFLSIKSSRFNRYMSFDKFLPRNSLVMFVSYFLYVFYRFFKSYFYYFYIIVCTYVVYFFGFICSFFSYISYFFSVFYSYLVNLMSHSYFFFFFFIYFIRLFVFISRYKSRFLCLFFFVFLFLFSIFFFLFSLFLFVYFSITIFISGFICSNVIYVFIFGPFFDFIIYMFSFRGFVSFIRFIFAFFSYSFYFVFYFLFCNLLFFIRSVWPFLNGYFINSDYKNWSEDLSGEANFYARSFFGDENLAPFVKGSRGEFFVSLGWARVKTLSKIGVFFNDFGTDFNRKKDSIKFKIYYRNEVFRYCYYVFCLFINSIYSILDVFGFKYNFFVSYRASVRGYFCDSSDVKYVFCVRFFSYCFGGFIFSLLLSFFIYFYFPLFFYYLYHGWFWGFILYGVITSYYDLFDYYVRSVSRDFKQDPHICSGCLKNSFKDSLFSFVTVYWYRFVSFIFPLVHLFLGVFVVCGFYCFSSPFCLIPDFLHIVCVSFLIFIFYMCYNLKYFGSGFIPDKVFSIVCSSCFGSGCKDCNYFYDLGNVYVVVCSNFDNIFTVNFFYDVVSFWFYNNWFVYFYLYGCTFFFHHFFSLFFFVWEIYRFCTSSFRRFFTVDHREPRTRVFNPLLPIIIWVLYYHFLFFTTATATGGCINFIMWIPPFMIVAGFLSERVWWKEFREFYILCWRNSSLVIKIYYMLMLPILIFLMFVSVFFLIVCYYFVNFSDIYNFVAWFFYLGTIFLYIIAWAFAFFNLNFRENSDVLHSFLRDVFPGGPRDKRIALEDLEKPAEKFHLPEESMLEMMRKRPLLENVLFIFMWIFIFTFIFTVLVFFEVK